MQAILTYNPRNKLAQRTLDYIMSLGVFRVENLQTKSNSLVDDFKMVMREMNNADKGVVKLQDAEDLLNEL